MNCPKCNDPVEAGETFCGKCGAPVPAQKSSQSQPQAKSQSQPQASSKQQSTTYVPKKKKGLLLGVVAVVVIVAILLVLYFTGVLGGSAAVKKYVTGAGGDFQNVVDNLGKLEKTLTYETSGDAEKDLAKFKEEVDDINSTRTALDAAITRLGGLRTAKETKELGNRLNAFYNTLKVNMETRYGIVNYFYESGKLGDKMSKSMGAFGEEDYNPDDITQFKNDIQQLKIILDQAVGDMEAMTVPGNLKEMHDSDIEMLKQMSDVLGDIVLAIDRMDEMGLISGFTRFTTLVSEYDTKTQERYKEILGPEFDNLNNALDDLNKKKDSVEEEFARLKGKYNIQSSALRFLESR
ncbi:MAG: hypothetical protein ACD_50C00218G0002 [uncultured bacterium]|nr:MAG: hypothetical protein ACD_50C00218G0002 [uncultured bacterium]